MPRNGGGTRVPLDHAVELCRTGDLWLFRGRTVADRAIRITTNAPVNHVGMALVIEDLPPLMWHAELGRSLPDLWSGGHRRGAQLHDLRDAVLTWTGRYRQRCWWRQLTPEVDRVGEDAALRSVGRLNGTPFPSTLDLASSYLAARMRPRARQAPDRRAGEAASAYCAQIVAATYQDMGLLPTDRRPDWYDPGRFWSGDGLELLGGATLGHEIEIDTGDAVVRGSSGGTDGEAGGTDGEAPEG